MKTSSRLSSVLLNPEEELILSFRNGDPEAIAILHRLYARAAYLIFFRVIRDPTAAEDLVQELFLRIWRRAAQFDAERGHIKDWVLSSARHMAIDYLRSPATKTEALMLHFEQLPAPSNSKPASCWRVGVTFPEFVKDSFASLSGQQRQIMELAYLEGYSHAEISVRLQVPLGTIKGRVRAALTQLRLSIEARSHGPTSN